MLFDPINYIRRYEQLDGFISDFNKFFAFDKWQLVRKDAFITFQRAEKIEIPQTPKVEAILSEDVFLNQQFGEIKFANLGLDEGFINVIKLRFDEIKKCLKSDASLAAILLSGSSLEGVLLGVAVGNPKSFNTAASAPKKDGKVKLLHEWSLSNLIDTAHELGVLKEDVRKFSHALRDFRNYIHPLQQVNSGFNPDKHTAGICWQVLRAAIHQLNTYPLRA
jgi:hypothetical protein